MRKLFSGIASLLFISLAVASIYSAYFVVNNQVHFARIASNSMAPRFHAGDTLILKSIPTKSLKVGDIALLPLKDNSGIYYTHRIISKTVDFAGKITVTTKGDANPVADNWKSTITSERTPIYIGQLPTSALPYIPPKTWFIFLFSLAIAFLLVSLVRRNLLKNEISHEANN